MAGGSSCNMMQQSHAGVKEHPESGPPGLEPGEIPDHYASVTSDPDHYTSVTSDPDAFNRRLCKRADKPFTCSTCSKSFSTSSHLALHVCTRTRDRKPERCRYRCRKHACSKAFSRPSQLVRHMASHVGEKPFKCQDCGRCFGRGSHLETHRRLHTGEKPFQCVVCGKSFTQKSGLIVHARKHTGERPYKCDKCGDAFGTAAHLLSHQAVEAGEGRHTCATCRESFRTVSVLRHHEKIHRESHTALTHTCSVCSGPIELRDGLPHPEPDVCVFHCGVCGGVFTDMDSFETHCRRHQTEKSVYDVEEVELDDYDDDDEEEEEEEEVGKRKNSARDPPFRLHVATSATRYTSEVSTRSRTRARSSTEALKGL